MRTILLTCVILSLAVGCAKKAPPPTTAAPAFTPTSTPNVSDTPPPSTSSSTGSTSSGNTNYVGGGGAVQNVRQAARRTIALNDFHQLGLAIKQIELQDGSMPDKNRILAEVKTYPNLPAAINEGTIILTGSKDSNGLLAYEIEADTKGGIVLVGGTARRADASEVKQLLGKK